MKKIIMFFTMALFLGFGVNAQTLSTETFNSGNANLPVVGANFDVPVNAASVGDVYTLTVYVEYDNTVMSYTGSANAVANTTVSEQTTSVIKVIIGDFPNITTVADGKLVDLQFDYIGGDGDITFHTSDYGAYASSYLSLAFSTVPFADADVTNGGIEGGNYETTISGGDWDTGSNWSTGYVPNSFANVTVASGTVTTATDASFNDLTIGPNGQLTIDGTFDVSGDFVIESDATGSGSFIDNGTFTVTGTTTVDCFVTSGQWHGFAAPVSGEDFNAMYLGGSPNVWIREYDEATNTYSPMFELDTPMGDMMGWMTFVETDAADQTFTFTGALRTGTVGSTSNLENTALGHNFVGNPYSSAIDWDAASGWTKTNLYDAIYVYNGTTFSSYVSGVGTAGGTNNIAMSQGFFVQAATAGAAGLQMTNAVQAHSTVGFMKSQDAAGQIIRLELADADKVDDAVIRLIDGATTEYDGNLDASKMFSFKDDFPQIYSTANDFMSINSLPADYNEAISMDVRGQDGNTMTISLSEAADFDKLYLKDELTDDIVNLKEESYTFTYDASVEDRFTILFGITGLEEGEEISKDLAKVYGSGRNINVVLNDLNDANIAVFNILGQNIVTTHTSNQTNSIAVTKSGYYFVQITNGEQSSTSKVFIK